MTPVVISGGSGTRLWPVSRANYPKQFCQLFDESLQLKTLRRLMLLGSPWTLTVESLAVLSRKTMSDLKIPAEQILLEPLARNTAPAIALLCRYFQLRGLSDEVVGLFPADQLVENDKMFVDCVHLAENCAQQGRIVTLGIQPSFPATGYGYIEVASESLVQQGSLQALKARGFREKPRREAAEEFLRRGGFYWNAGIFVFKISKMAELFAQHQSELWQAMQGLHSDLSNLGEVYQVLKPESIDYAIMEKLSDMVCIPSDIGWSDVGSWEEIARLKQDQVARGVVTEQSKDCFVFGQEHKVYGLTGVDDLLVIDTPDALLVSRKGHSQDVKKVVEVLKAQGQPQAESHPFDHRPWGRYEVLTDRGDFKAKIITINPGQRISYQSHARRSEHWVVIAGQGEVTVNESVRAVGAGSYVFIPEQAKHRISCTGNEPLRFAEIQLGSYFGEDDITRYQDDYRRK